MGTKALNKLTAREVIRGLRAREFTSRQVTEACLSQIAALDPEIKAFITVTKERALADAEQADKETAASGEKAFVGKPLLGVPYACKDNFNTYGIQTTAGSVILKGYIPPYESTVTRKLQEAGAVLLGKTNMDAFAHGSSTETSDYFKTKNPRDLTRVPGGSSGGSAAAVASDMCIFAIGSETAGSVRGPAAWCGIVGLKPTYGRVSRYGVVAMASSTDSPGPLTKTVEDAALILGVIAGKDKFDATSSELPVPGYSNSLSKLEEDLSGIKIGVPHAYMNGLPGLEEAVKSSIDEAVNTHLKKLGAEVSNPMLLDPKYSIAVYTILQRSEVSSNLARFDGIRYGQTRDHFGFEAKKRMLLGAYTLSSGYYDEYYSKAQKVRSLIVEDFARVFKEVDVIAAPTMPCVALKFASGDLPAMFGEMMDVLAEPSSIAGLPAISVPCGEDPKTQLPIGIQFIGPQFAEERVLQVAKAYEHSRGEMYFGKE